MLPRVNLLEQLFPTCGPIMNEHLWNGEEEKARRNWSDIFRWARWPGRQKSITSLGVEHRWSGGGVGELSFRPSTPGRGYWAWPGLKPSSGDRTRKAS